jgi:cytochrome c553
MPLPPRCRLTLILLFQVAGAVIVSSAAAETAPAHLDTCTSCHGVTGRSASGDIPHLAGQQKDYLVQQLRAFRSGERKNELMQAVAAQLGPEDILALADYWSRMPQRLATLPGQAGTHAPPGAHGAAGSGAVSVVASEMRMPVGFPAGFTEYDRAIDLPTRVVTVRFANNAALQSARTGSAMPTGAVVMSGEYAAVLDPAGEPVKDAQGRALAGALRTLAGMEVRSGWGAQVPALLRNGDWHYGLWSATGVSRLKDMHAQCLACHQPLAGQRHVFTWGALTRQAKLAGP